VVLVEATRARLLALVAVVLLIDAMKLQQLLLILGEGRRVLDELFLDQAAEMIAPGLDRLISRKLVQGNAV